MSEDEVSEDVIWKGGPSQILNLRTFLIAFVLIAAIGFGGTFYPLVWALAVLPLAWAVWRFLVVRCQVYELTTERLRLYEGVFNQEIGEVELYRVKDTNVFRPFWLRLFKMANIVADTSDRTHPSVNMMAVKDGLNVRELLRKQVETLRDKKRVREVDFDGSGDGDDIEFGA